MFPYDHGEDSPLKYNRNQKRQSCPLPTSVGRWRLNSLGDCSCFRELNHTNDPTDVPRLSNTLLPANSRIKKPTLPFFSVEFKAACLTLVSIIFI